MHHARTVLYTNENRPYFQLPDSRIIALMAAMQGKYSSTNTMNANAEAGVNGV